MATHNDRKYQNDLKRAFRTLDSMQTPDFKPAENPFPEDAGKKPPVESAAPTISTISSPEKRMVFWRSVAITSSVTCAILFALIVQNHLTISPPPRAAVLTPQVTEVKAPVAEITASAPPVALTEPVAQMAEEISKVVVTPIRHVIIPRRSISSIAAAAANPQKYFVGGSQPRSAKGFKTTKLKSTPPALPSRGPGR